MVGAALLNAFSFMFLIFGLILLYTAVQLFRHRDEDPSIEDNALVRAGRRFLPVTDDYVEGKMITRVDGKRMVTPLFLVLLAIGGTDLLFALDSIPAVFGVTEEAYIVFAANAFALLGLRALFFLVKGLLDRLVYLSTGLALILGVDRFMAEARDPEHLDAALRRHQPELVVIATRLEDGHPYLQAIRVGWGAAIHKAFHAISHDPGWTF
mgnify:CR=1 FL=1